MDCEQAAGLFPALLNRTLEASLKEDVRGHVRACAVCRADLADARETWSLYGQHIPSADLVDHAFDRPTTIARAVIAGHVESCADCREELELVQANRRDEAIAADAEPAVTARRGWTVPHAWRTWPQWATAAALVVWTTGVFVLGGRMGGFTGRSEFDRVNAENVRLRQDVDIARARGAATDQAVSRLEDQMARLNAPQLNALVVELLGEGRVERSRPTVPAEIEIPANATTIAFVLNPVNRTSPAILSVDLAGAAGNIVWRGDGLTRQPTGDYAITIPARLLASGDYVIDLRGQDAGRTLVEQFRLRIR
jgi:hypothetical protein